jgi:deoxyribonucleoside regulator
MTDPATTLMSSAARLYYLDGLEQREVASILGVSRSKVSRLLTAARERGIVRITVDPYEPRHVDLEHRLRDRFGLRQAVVVKTIGRGVESVRRTVGYFAAPPVAALIRPGAIVGMAGGRTLGEVIGFLPSPEHPRHLTVVQLMGHIDPTASRSDAPELGRLLAQRLGGSFFTLAAPAFVVNRETRDTFLAHEHIRLLWRHFEALDLALVGIGTPEESLFAERGVLDPEAAARLRALGAVGEICGRFFDRDGRECPTPYRDRVISIDLEVLRQRPEVVGVTNGPGRREAILAALRGGLITALVIDDRGAEAVLRTAETA